MFLPPEQRTPWYPPQKPERGLSKRGEAVMLWLIGVFLMLMLVAPLGGSTVIHALIYLMHH